jgi:hypothetical protein
MARYQILYWRDIPAQVRVEGGHEDVSSSSIRAQQRIDSVAMQLGLQGTDASGAVALGDPREREGRQNVAAAIKRELEMTPIQD